MPVSETPAQQGPDDRMLQQIVDDLAAQQLAHVLLNKCRYRLAIGSEEHMLLRCSCGRTRSPKGFYEESDWLAQRIVFKKRGISGMLTGELVA